MNITIEDNKEIFDNWLSWKQRTIKLPNRYTSSGKSAVRHLKPSEDVLQICDSIGLRENIDYVFRRNELRFATTENLAFFKLNYK